MKKHRKPLGRDFSSVRLNSSFGRLALLIGFIPLSLAAEPAAPKDPAPQIMLCLPLGIQPGKTTKLIVRGIHLDKVKEIKVHEPHSSGKVLGKGKKVSVPDSLRAERVGDSEIEIEITLPKEIAGATVPFSLINSTGTESITHRLIVNGDVSEIVEKEPNDSFKSAQALTLPALVIGNIGRNQDIDIFKWEGKKGDRLACELQAARFHSPLDGVLLLFDSEGRLLQNAGETGSSVDPLLKFTLPKDGTYYLSLIDAQDHGGSLYLYQLSIRVDRN